MKRTIIIFILCFLVLSTGVIWLLSYGNETVTIDLVHAGVIVFLVAFALFVGIKRLSASRKGQPAEDELSKKVLQKSAAFSYFISLYLWVFMIFIKDRIEMDTEELLGTGILGMAIIFAICWLVFNFRGIKNE